MFLSFCIHINVFIIQHFPPIGKSIVHYTCLVHFLVGLPLLLLLIVFILGFLWPTISGILLICFNHLHIWFSKFLVVKVVLSISFFISCRIFGRHRRIEFSSNFISNTFLLHLDACKYYFRYLFHITPWKALVASFPDRILFSTSVIVKFFHLIAFKFVCFFGSLFRLIVQWPAYIYTEFCNISFWEPTYFLHLSLVLLCFNIMY